MIQEIAGYQEIIQKKKNLFGKSLLMANAEAHHESLAFRKEELLSRLELCRCDFILKAGP